MTQQQLDQLFATGGRFFNQRQFAEAAQMFYQAANLAPQSFAAWTNLSAAYTELNQPQKALEAIDKAIAIKPDLAIAHANRGDALRMLRNQWQASFDAYRRAAELEPDSPHILNKLGVSLHILLDFDGAEKVLRKAVRLAPEFREARVNLGSTLEATGQHEEFRALMEQSLSISALRPQHKDEFAAALAIHDENKRIGKLVDQAVHDKNPQTLLSVKMPETRLTQEYDARLVSCLDRCLQNTNFQQATSHTFQDQQLLSINHMLEAHFSAHLGDTVEAALGTIAFLRNPEQNQNADVLETTAKKLLDARQYYDAIQHYYDCKNEFNCDAGNVSHWVRYWHALLTQHRSEIGPGRYKAMANSVSVNSHVKRTMPAQVMGTLRTVYEKHYTNLPRGAARAALVYYTLADTHSFPDGNGRLGRFLMNRELENSGLTTVVVPKRLKPVFGRALKSIREGFDLMPFMEWLAICDDYTQDIRKQVVVGLNR